jgi:hypothetical protein
MRTQILTWTLLSVLCSSGCVKAKQLSANSQTKPKPGPGIFFVATNGDDAWSGSLPQPELRRNDGPFATLTRARDAARRFRETQGVTLTQPVMIYVRGGCYLLQKPFLLDATDSGKADSPLMITAYPGEKPVISGGRRITGWQEVMVDGKKLWAADVPDVREGKWFFRELWVNGERRVRARHPNKGYLKVEGVPDKMPNWAPGQTRFQFHDGDIKAWPTITNAEVVSMSRWIDSHLPVTSVDEENHIVNFGKRSVAEFQLADPYYLEGAFEALDVPGEWYLDTASGRLLYIPMRGEQPDRIEAIAPVLSQVLRIEGQPQAGRFVEHVEFRGLTFANTEWDLLPASVAGFNQAAVGVPGAVWGEGVRVCAFERCIFTRLGNYALELARGAQSNRVSICEFSDLGCGGIKIGEQGIRSNANEMALENEISDCRIYDGGKLFPSAVGIWIGQSPKNRIVHNLIHDFYYTGISVGWTWGYGPALASNNIVDLNIIHHIGVKSDMDGPILSDMGGIYTLGKQPGTRITRNLWHDIAGVHYGGWGIYFDEGSSGILAENNIVYRTTHGGFHQHYGETNLVRNNIFAFGRDHQIQRSKEEDHISFTFLHNLVLFDRGVLLGGTWKNDRFIMNSSLYWDMRLNKTNANQMKFAGVSFEDWRKRGHDTNSLIADPLFAAPKSGIFRVKTGSPAPDIGFRAIDLSEVGPRY